jgi:hypothetical protein
VNAFTISWDADDRFIAVSTRSIPRTARPWQCIVFAVEKGPICEYPYADVFFIGSGRLVACARKESTSGWHERELLLLKVQENALVEEQVLPGRMPAAASRPDEGVYLVWQEPPWWELWTPKGYWLELRKIDRVRSVRNLFFAEATSLTLVRSHLALPFSREQHANGKPDTYNAGWVAPQPYARTLDACVRR